MHLAVGGVYSLFAVSVAAITMGTADTLFSVFLCFDDIPYGSPQDHHQNRNNNDIFHTYFLPLRAYSAFSFLSELTHR